MCQLLGMNCNVPTDICFSFTGFQARGGKTDHHTDGWGIAFFEGKGLRHFLDPQASALSPIAEMVRQYPMKSTTVIAHLRKATQGGVSLENTHPFVREMWGRPWVFAHNGTIPDFHPDFTGPYRPVGTTDSERVFCYLLQEIRAKYGDQKPTAEELFGFISDMCRHFGKLGAFNFLLSNGEFLIAHCSTKLSYVLRKAPFPRARLADEDVTVDLSSVTSLNDRVAIIATLPLTQNEQWTTIEQGTLLLFRDGVLERTVATVKPPVAAQAHV